MPTNIYNELLPPNVNEYIAIIFMYRAAATRIEARIRYRACTMQLFFVSGI